MASASILTPSSKSQEKLIAYYKTIQTNMNQSRGEQRSRFEKIDKRYQGALDLSREQARAKAANLAGDPKRLQNITVPVVLPQVEAAVVYQSSVYLTGDPIFGVVASPEFIDEALQMESVIEDNSLRGGWARHFMMFFRDGFKYNYAPLEVSWGREVTWTIETNVDKSLTEGVPKEVIWAGNKVERLDPYNTFADARVPATEVYKDGEFAGYTKVYSRIKLKSFIAELPDHIISNVVPAFESASHAGSSTINAESLSFYTPRINTTVNVDEDTGEMDWMKWAKFDGIKRKIDYKDSYEVTTLYCKVLFSEFDLMLPKANTPQILKLIIVNHSVIIYAELQTNAHNYLPILIGSPLEDGLRYQTKSLAENAAPFQDAATSHMTSATHARRRAVTDRMLFDPSMVDSKHINSANPSAKIPVRPTAYGKKISDAVYQFPFRDELSGTAMVQIQALIALANVTSGQNPAQQGQFVKGNKTLAEFEDVMRNANGRDQLASMLIEYQCFLPLKHIIKINILQFQGGITIYNRDKDVSVEIDPVALRKAVLDFRVSDGLTPASKILSTDTLSTALLALSNSPALGQGFNMAPMFSYLLKTQGADLKAFEKSPEQVAYEQAVSQWREVAVAAIAKGVLPANLPEQPKPEEFKYDPSNNKPAPKGLETTNQNPDDKGVLSS